MAACTVGASSQCYWDELMLLRCELMILKCHINTNTNKYGFLLHTKCLEGVLKFMCGDFLSQVCELYNHIKLIVYEVIKNRQNNHIIPLYFYSKQKKYSSFNIMLVI